MNPRLVVFDWDGTLMDSIGTIVACMRAALADLGVPPAVEPSSIRHSIGLGLREALDALYPGADDEFRTRIVEAYRRHWFDGHREQQVLFPAVPELLADLAGRGLLLGVATGKSRRGLDHDLAKTGLASSFNATRTVDEGPSKPAPGMLLDLLEELGVDPADALMVGDTTYDLEMARNAGVAAVGVTSGAQGAELLTPFSPRAILPWATALPGWLDKLPRRTGS